MINIKFKKIIVEGFGSFVKGADFPLERGGGVNIVRGLNGSGKTTIFNALFWCLYGENLKGVTQSKLSSKKKYRTKDWRGTRVGVTFEVDDTKYMVVRHISYKGTTKGIEGGSSLMILKDGELIGSSLHKDDQKQFLIDLIGMDSRVFLNSILFGQRMKKFIEAKPDEKRKIFESLFDLEFIEESKQKAKEYREDINNKKWELGKLFEKNGVRIEHLLERINSSKSIIENFNVDKKQRIDVLTKRKAYTTGELKYCKESLAQINKIITELDKNINELGGSNYDSLLEKRRQLKHRREIIFNSIANTNHELKECRSSRDKFKEELTNADMNCPSCLQPLPQNKLDEARSRIKDKIASLDASIDVHTKYIEKTKKEFELIANNEKLDIGLKEQKKAHDKLKELEDKKQRKNIDLSECKVKMQNCNHAISQLDADIKIEAEKQPPKVDIDKLQKEVKMCEAENKKHMLEIDKKTEELEKIDWWIKTGFGSGGLRSYVFNSMMTLLNTAIKKYASRLGFLVQFSIDMEKASKPFLTKCYTINKVEMDYDEFSGGEKARVDIASAFAVHDLVGSSSNINILIMDEIFEGLDEDGIEDAFDLIRLKAEGKNLYIITHSKAIDSLNCKHIDIIKENNNTIIS